MVHTVISVIMFSLMSLVVVEMVGNYIGMGYMDDVEYLDGEYYENGKKKDYYPTYKAALEYGQTGEFIYAEDGFVYKDTSGVGVKQFVMSYQWYQGRHLEPDKALGYIKGNKVLLVMRIMVLSNQLLTSILLFLILVVIDEIIYDIMLKIAVSVYGFIHVLGYLGDKQKKGVRRLSEVRLIKKVINTYPKENIYGIVSALVLAMTVMMRTGSIYSTMIVSFWINMIIMMVYMVWAINKEYLKIIKAEEMD